MSGERTRAIVLRRTNYGEADRILQLITPEGKRSVIARGVRREKSRLAGGIELFAVSDVVIQKGKGELGILSSARLVVFYRHILTDYDALQFGYAATAHIAKASEAVDTPEWYDILQQTFAGLDAPLPLPLVKLWFYLRFARLMGYELSLVNDINGQKLQADRRYSYDVAERGLRPAASGELTADHIKFLRLVDAKPLSVIAQVGGLSSVLGECVVVARQHAAIE